jgi:hypothetical protein
MAHPLHHSISSAQRFGGEPEDYQTIHDWFDASKEHMAFFTHRALRHHTQGIFEAERLFGRALINSAGRVVPVRWIGEQHVKEDCRGRVPSMCDWLGRIKPESWMGNGHIDADSPAIDRDPRAAWIEAVASQQTVLGLEDWLHKISAEIASLEQHGHTHTTNSRSKPETPRIP